MKMVDPPNISWDKNTPHRWEYFLGGPEHDNHPGVFISYSNHAASCNICIFKGFSSAVESNIELRDLLCLNYIGAW